MTEQTTHQVTLELDDTKDDSWRLRCSCAARSGWTTHKEVERIGRAHLGQPLTDEDVAANLEARLVARGGPSANIIFAGSDGRTVRAGINQFNELDDGLAASGK